MAWSKLKKFILFVQFKEEKLSGKEIYDLGEMPELGHVPEKMHAFTVRQDRFGEPKDAWQREILNVPELGPKDVLVYVCLLYTSPSPRDGLLSRMPSSA